MQKRGSRGLRFTGDQIKYLQDIEVQGNLYDLGSYPALTMGKGKVKAELFELINNDLMYTFDQIEGYGRGDPEGHLYTRTVVWVEEINDFAWIYTFNDRIDPERLIESGDWHEHKNHQL